MKIPHEKSIRRRLQKLVQYLVISSATSLSPKDLFDFFIEDPCFVNSYNLWVEGEFAKELSPSLWAVGENLNSLDSYKVVSHQERKERTQQKREKTNLERYGSISSLTNPEVKKKTKATCLKKYGTEFVSSSDEWKQSVKAAVKLKYGVDSIAHLPEVKKKKAKTNQERYGVDHVLQLPEVLEKQQQTMLKRYSVKNAGQHPELKRKAVKGMIETKIKTGSMTILPTQETIQQFSKRVGFCLTTCHKNIKELGFELASKLMSNRDFLISGLERITEHQLGLIPLAGKTIINKYKPDFKVTDNLYLDVDGLYYHSELVQQNQNYHMVKREAYEKQGLRLVQIREDEIVESPEIVQSMVNSLLGTTTKVFARKCNIKQINYSTYKEFCLKNHLQGSGRSGPILLGLYKDQELVQCIGLVKGFNKTKKELYLDRFCTLLNHSVIGGFSKLLKEANKLCKDSKIESILSFCDLRYSEGNVYTKTGFEFVNETLSWGWTDFKKVYHRLKVHKLSEGYEKGLVRIFDAGQRKYLYKVV